MENMINKELIKKLRSERTWSQEELATASSLSHRTIQRIESTGKCSLDSKRALAAAFNINTTDLDIEEPSKSTDKNIFRFYNLSKTISVVLIVPILITAAVYGVRNYQHRIEFEFVIANPGDISSQTYQVNLSRNGTNVVELTDGYTIEIDKIPGLTPRLKTQLFQIDQHGKHLLHASNRMSTDFKPVKYVVCAEKRVLYISPNNGLNSKCENI